MRPELPTGTVTFLFTDVEGSTRLLHELGAEAYAGALGEHRRVIRGACVSHGGVEVDTQGDAFFFAFPTAPGALAAAAALTEALSMGPIRVRVGVYTGTPLVTDEGYVGSDVHRAARIAAAGHGGQVLVASSTAALVDVELRDLGDHRFKDLAEPERVYQLESREFPPLKSLFRTNLPVAANPLVGRARELEDVIRLLAGDGPSLITLTGPGGVGKTRFAVAAAAGAAASFPHGVWFVPLANLRSPDLVLPTIASVLGAEGDVARHVGEDACLLVLDNLEQVIDAAAEIAALASSCPRLRILITSREVLRVGAEREYPLGPLSSSSSVELFHQRATGVEPGSLGDLETIAALCDRLDRLPLAIELAAVRTKALSPAQLLERLSARLDLLKGGRDVDPRHATLRATIEWSFDLLSVEEQQLFERLGVFVGGCTLEAAETVAEADIDSLLSLVEKSLIRFGGERYGMLETIYAYARDRLEASADAASMRRRHAEWVAAFVERVEPELDLRTQGLWLDRMDAEHDNLRAALRWATATQDGTLALRLAGPSGTFWWVRGHATEGRRWLDAALAVPGETPPMLRARALEEAAHLAHRQGDSTTARRLADESVRLAEQSGDTGRLARTLRILALVAGGEGDQARFRTLVQMSADAARASQDQWALIMALNNLGCIALEDGEAGRARALLEEASSLAGARGDERSEAFVLENLAFALLAANDAAAARPTLARSLILAHSLRFLEVVATDLIGVAAIATAQHDLVGGARMLGAARAMLDQIGAALDPIEEASYEETRETLEDRLGLDAYGRAFHDGSELGLEAAVELAMTAVGPPPGP